VTFIDEMSPSYVGENRIRLTLARPDDPLVAFAAVLINVDYGKALPEGIELPLEFTVTSPTDVNNTRQVFERFPPTQLAFTPREGGSHLVRLGEIFHNRWWGSLVLEISGDRIRTG
jgi:hypothetical protein